MREARDLELSIEDAERRLSEDREKLRRLQHDVLPDMFSDARMRELTLDPEGNLPPFKAQMRPFYKAGIAADWDEERREEAFEALREAGGEDLIKTVITVELPPGDRKMAERVERGLRQLKIAFTSQLSVHWRTLTSFVQEQCEARPPRSLPLEKLGAVVGRRVTIKPENGKWRR